MASPEIARKLADYFAAKPVLRAYLFGSYARGEQRPNSDVDVLVELDYEHGGASFDTWCAMEDDLTALMDRKVDLVSANGLSKFIGPFIHAEKKLVYERSGQRTTA